MKTIIKYLMISLFFTMLYYFTNSVLSNPPDYISEISINFLMWLNKMMEKPFWFFSLFFDEGYIKENSLTFAFISSLFFAIPVSWLFSDKINDFDTYQDTYRPYILTEYENIDKEKKENIFPTGKKSKFLNNIGKLKMTNLEKEIYYNISICLPEDVRKVFSYQIKKIKSTSRLMIPSEKREAFSFVSFKTIFGNVSLKKLFSTSMLKAKIEGNEFVLATVIFKDKYYDNLIAEVWVKNLRIDKIVFKGEKDLDLNKNYDYKYTVTKINSMLKD